MPIKKVHTEIIDFLKNNETKQVSEILSQIIEISSTRRKTAKMTNLKNSDGKIVGILCHYYKKWMPLVGDLAVEFGEKKTTSTGINPMSKLGLAQWAKQNNLAKKLNSQLVERVISGELSVEQLAEEKEKIEEQRKQVAKTELGFEAKEEIINYLRENGIEIIAE